MSINVLTTGCARLAVVEAKFGGANTLSAARWWVQMIVVFAKMENTISQRVLNGFERGVWPKAREGA